MADWFIVNAFVSIPNTDALQVTLRIPTRDGEIRNHMNALAAQGFDVIDIKILPWPTNAEVVAAVERIVDENSNTTEITGSSD
ncbi:MAG TPA: hypothetical protein VLG09_03850 [Candidatus Saccharimonadales bacterium]|nr:hypothetical protein [Candidatus Saccharimonadales bacterium]